MGAGVGMDLWTPSTWKGWPDFMLQGLLLVLRGVEQQVAFPLQTLVVKVALLAKPAGGERPISIISTLMRTWTAVRAPALKAWEQGQIEWWDTAIAGSSALRAGLSRLVKDELARFEGDEACSIMWDVKKFYDSLGWEEVMEEAGSRGFSPKALALLVQTYMSPRVLKAKGDFSQLTEVSNSVTAGCRFGLLMARLALYAILGPLHASHPEFGPQQYVDDMAQQAQGLRRVIVPALGAAAVELCARLAAARLEVSTKSTIVASSPTAAKELQNYIKDATGLELTVGSSVADLGLLNCAAKFRPSAILQKRMNKTKHRISMICRAARVVKEGWQVKQSIDKNKKRKFVFAHKLFRTGALPAATFGIEGAGCNAKELHKLSVQAARCTAHYISGANVGVINRLMYGDYKDPEVTVPVQVVMEWVKFWRALDAAKRSRVHKLWMHNVHALNQPETRWKMVRGFVSGVVATLYDVGWRPVAPTAWLTRARGERQAKIIKLDDKVSIKQAQRELTWELEQQAWERIGSHPKFKGLEAGGMLGSVRRHLSHLRGGAQPGAYSMLVTVVSGGIWTGLDCKEAGYPGSALCPRCEEADDTERHRCWECQANEEDEDPRVAGTQQLQGLAQQHCADEPGLWLRGICSKMAIFRQPVLPSRLSTDPPRARRCSHWWTDGSGGAHTAKPWARRCGWSAVALGGHPRHRRREAGEDQLVKECQITVDAVLAGGLGGDYQTVPRSETTAIMEVLKEVDQDVDLFIFTDCMPVAKTWEAGAREGEDSINGDLWANIWDIIRTRTGSVHVEWIPSHTSEGDVESGSIARLDHIGNTAADGIAGWAAANHSHKEEDIEKQEELIDLAGKVRARLVAVHTACAAITGPRERHKAPAVARPARRPISELVRLSPHDVVIKAHRWQCRKCLQGSGAAGVVKWLTTAPCPARPGAAPPDRVEPAGAQEQEQEQPQAAQPAASRDEELNDQLRHLHGVFPGAAAGHRQLAVKVLPDAPLFFLGRPTGHQYVVGATALHKSHALLYRQGVLACVACGAWASEVPRALGLQCRRGLTQAGRDVISRLRRGLTPKSSIRGWPLSEDADLPAAVPAA